VLSRGRVFYEYRYWSPVLGCNAVRISMADELGREYHAIVSAENPGFRERRDAALSRLHETILAGDDAREIPTAT